MNARIEFFRNQIGKDTWAFPYPLMDWLKVEVVEADEEHVKLHFTIEKYMLNPLGILHGGVAATMLDELMGAAAFLVGRPNGYATINMNVDFLRSAKAGEVIIGEGRVVRVGKSVMHAESKLYNVDNHLLAKATSNLIATSVTLPI